MRRLILCLAAIAATSAYNLVIQELALTGGRITSDEINCKNINEFHVDGKTYNIDCLDVWKDAEPKTIDSRKVVFTSSAITTSAKYLNCELILSDSSKLAFQLQPTMKVGDTQTAKPGVTYTPVATTTTAAPPTTTAAPDYCADADNAKKHFCFCQDAANKNSNPCADCKDAANRDDPACQAPQDPPKSEVLKLPAKATKVKLPRVPIAPEVDVNSALPPAIRMRGPGPARPPAHHFPIEDSVVEEEDEVRRVKRDDDTPPKVDDTTINVAVSYYVLDEPGNPAAVWAACIEGIILILLVGACLYFFRRRPSGAASAAADPYKPEGNYSVSYANSSYNQRIDAFQNPPPAAPPRPANSAYMDDYITDNIGAMGRPAATTTQPTATAASAANPATSNFTPGHQRFDSSGLVTVNLS